MRRFSGIRMSKASPASFRISSSEIPIGSERPREHRFGLTPRILERDPEGGQCLGGYALVSTENAEQKVLIAQRVVAQHPGFLQGSIHAAAGFPGETIEDHPLPSFLPGGLPGYLDLILAACFLCTACLLTPRASAILAHDQPAMNAFSTCAASNASNIRLSATTDSNPARGSSGPPTRVLVFSSMCQL